MTLNIRQNTSLFFNLIKKNAESWMNYLFVLYMFFLPLDGPYDNIFFIILILFFIRGNVLIHLKRALQNRVVLSFVLIFAISVIWTLGSDDTARALINVQRFKVLLYPVIIYSFIRPEFVAKMLGGFMLGMFVSELISYSIFFDLIDSPKHFGSPHDPTPFYHHTHYGLLLAFSAGLLLYRAIAYHDNRWARLVMFLFFTTITINIFITGGRMGYILYAIVMFSILLMHRAHIVKTLLVTIAATVTVFYLAYQFSPSFHERFESTLHGFKKLDQPNRFQSSFGARLGMAYYSLPVIKEHWLLGVGTGDHMPAMYHEVEKADVPEDRHLKTIHFLHNAHFTILVQFGLIGFLFWLNSYYQIIRYEQKNPFLRTVLTLSVITLFFFSLFDTMFKAQMAIIFSTIVTVALIDVKGRNLNQLHLDRRELLFYILGIPTMYLIGAYS